MLNSHYADSDDGETEWPLTQRDWLSYDDSQEPIPLEQEPDPDREEEIEREEQRQREFDRDSDLDLGSQMYPEPSQDMGSDQDSEQDLDLVPTQEDEGQGLSMENQDSQQQEQKKNRSSKNVEETRGHRLPLFYQAQSEMQDLRSLRKYHMENLGQLLRRLLVRRDLVRASEIFELLFDSKDTSEEFIWKIGLEFLYSLEDYERESHGFLSWLFSKSRYHKQAILLELVLYQLRCGEIEEADLSLSTHVTVAPYSKDPLIQGYAGVIKMLLLEKASKGQKETHWRTYAQVDTKGQSNGPQSTIQNPHSRDITQNIDTRAWIKVHTRGLPIHEVDIFHDVLEGRDGRELPELGNDRFLGLLMDVPLRKPDVWNMKDAEEYEELRNDPINYLHDNATLSQSAALERLRQDAINFLERSLELEPSNDEFLQALVDLRLEFLDYRNFGRLQMSKITLELQEAIVDTKAYLRKHLLRHSSLKALHILSSLEAIVGSKEERIMILQEILEQDPGASSERVVQPLVQYYWQQLTPDEAELIAEIERTNDDDDDSHRDDHGNSRDDGGSDHPIRYNMTYEEENEEIAHFHDLLEEYGLDDPSAPYLLDVVENLAFLGRDLNMGAFEGPDREYEFSDETGEGVCETKRRLFAWPGRMKMPDTDDEEEVVEEENQEVAEAADEQVEKQKEWKEKKMQHQQRRKKERPLSMDDILGLPQFKSTGMERTLTGGTMVEQIQLHQLLLPTKSGHNSEEDEDDDEDPELLTPGTDIGTVRIIQKLDRHQPPVEPFRPILELLLRRAEFGVLTAWEENELVRICNLFCFCCLYCRRQTRLEPLWKTHLRLKRKGKCRMIPTCFDQFPEESRPYWFEKVVAILSRSE